MDKGTAPPVADSLVERDRAVFLSQVGSSPVRHAVTAAAVARIRDETGAWLYDLHGNGCHHLGYGHPRLVAAAVRQMTTLPFAPRRFTNEPAVALAEALAARWPGGAARVLFAPSGSDAIEIALKLARLATGRAATLAFDGAWHGAGMGALAVGGRARERPERLGPLLPDCQHAPAPDVWGDQPARESSARASLAAVTAILSTGRIGAFIAEPVCEGPARVPHWFWPELRALCDRHGTLLVFDEVPRGLGRTGRFFASEWTGIAPDVTVVGKALGGALVPLAATIARADLDVAPDLAIGHITHEKSALGAAIGREVLAVIDDDDLVARAGEIGARLAAALAAAGLRVGHVGATVALALPSADQAATAAFVERAYVSGVNLTASAGRSVLAPPLILGDDEVDDIAARIPREV